MRVRSEGLILGIVLSLVSLTVAEAQNLRIPTTHGTSLAGTSVTLPDDLRGRVGVLVLGFSKNSGDVCKGWGQRLAASYRDSRDVTYYQMPVLEAVPKMIRGMVVKGIKSGVPEAEQAHFVPVFGDEKEWQQIAHYANADDAYVLVVDGEGRVQWLTSGTVTDTDFAALKQRVETIRPQRANMPAK